MKIQRFFNGWAFINPQFGRTIIRCHSSATNVIKWTNSKSDFHYNIIDLDENDIMFMIHGDISRISFTSMKNYGLIPDQKTTECSKLKHEIEEESQQRIFRRIQGNNLFQISAGK